MLDPVNLNKFATKLETSFGSPILQFGKTTRDSRAVLRARRAYDSLREEKEGN